MTPEAFDGDVARLRERQRRLRDQFVDAEAAFRAESETAGVDRIRVLEQKRIFAARALAQIEGAIVHSARTERVKAALEAGAEEPVKHQHRKGCHRMALGHCDCAEPARQEPPPPVHEEKAKTATYFGPRPFKPGKLTLRVEHSSWSWHVTETSWKSRERSEAVRAMLRQFMETMDALPQEDDVDKADTGEPKRGGGVEGELRDLARVSDMLARNGYLPAKLIEIAESYRAERAEAERVRANQGGTVTERERDRAEAALRALQSTHEALVQRVRGVVERCQRVDMGAPSKYLALGIIADLTEGGGG